MIKLPITFVSAAGGHQQNPLTYTQVIRNDKVAVYVRSKDGLIRDYEVFKIRLTKAGTVQKFPNQEPRIVSEDIESYATTSDWGGRAFSFHGKFAKEAALRQYEKMSKSAIIDEVTDDSIEESPSFANTTFIFPNTEKFSTKDFAAVNNCEYITASLYIKESVKNGSIKAAGTERRQAKGKPTNLFVKS